MTNHLRFKSFQLRTNEKGAPCGALFVCGRGSKTSADKVRCTMSRINVETQSVSAGCKMLLNFAILRYRYAAGISP